MEDTLEVLNSLEQCPDTKSIECYQPPAYLASLIAKTDEFFRSHDYQNLESTLQSAQKTIVELQRQQQQDREGRLLAEAEVRELRTRNHALEDHIMHSEAIAKQSLALAQEQLYTETKDTKDLLVDLTGAFLVQYEYLRHRRAFTVSNKMPWTSLLRRIAGMECLQATWENHELKVAKDPAPEFKDTGTSCRHKEKPVAKKDMGTNTESEVLPDRKKMTKDVGVNTKAGHRITRATQATEIKTKSVDSGTQCEPSTSPVFEADEDFSCLDVNDILMNTICTLPDMLSGIDELELPKVSCACQTDVQPKTMSTGTLTDMNNLSRRLEFEPAAKRHRLDVVPEPVKRELNNEGDSGRSLDDFERYWSMAGRSLVNALMGQTTRDQELTTRLDGFQGQFLQQQLMAKFLSGQHVPVKRAVSIPSVYAESTKSGFEAEANGDCSRAPSEERATNIGAPISRRRSSSRNRSRESPSKNAGANKRRRRTSGDFPVAQEASLCPAEEVVDQEMNERTEASAEADKEVEVQSLDTLGQLQVALPPRKTFSQKSRLRNRTVDRILRARANVYKMKVLGVRKRTRVGREARVAVPFKRIQLRRRLDSVESQMSDGKWERVRDYCNVPQMMEPIAEDEEDIRQHLIDEAAVEDVNDGISHERVTNSQTRESKEATEGTMKMDPVEEVPPREPQLIGDFDSPASPPPSDRCQDPSHETQVIPSESQIATSNSSSYCLRNLKLTHTTINQFLQNLKPLKKSPLLPKELDLRIKEIVKHFLATEWTSESVSECVAQLRAVSQKGDCPIIQAAVVKAFLSKMEACEDNVNFEPFNSYAPFMPKTHQKVVHVVERLGIGQTMIHEIEQRLFTLKAEGAKMCGVVNWTWLYLSLQDLEINKRRTETIPLRFFLVKALYFLKRRSTIIVYMTLKAFPKLLPRLEKGQKFVVGEYDADPLVDVLVCILMGSGERPGTGKSEEVKVLAKYRSDLSHLLRTYYGYEQFHPKTEEVLKMLLERLRTPGRELNAVHGILLLAKHGNVAWAKEQLLDRDLLPRVRELLANGGGRLQPAGERELCLYFSVIAGVVKVFPRTEDVSLYLQLFRDVLAEKERFSHAAQECAVTSILRLAAFGVAETFNALRDWYVPPETISPQLRAGLETFLSRQWPQFWVKLSNGT